MRSPTINIIRYSNGTMVKLAASSHDIVSYDYDTVTSKSNATFIPNQVTIYVMFTGGLVLGEWQYSTDGANWYGIVDGQHGFKIYAGQITLSAKSDLFTDVNSVVNVRCIANDPYFYDTLTVTRYVSATSILRNTETKFNQTNEKIALIASDTQLAQYGSDGKTVYSDLQSQISVKADEIEASVAKTYQTKADAQQQDQSLRSAITLTEQNINSNVSSNYAKKTDVTSSFNSAKQYTDSALDTAKQYTDAAEQSAKGYATSEASAAESSAKNYADGKASTAESNAKSYADGKASSAESAAKKYADGIVNDLGTVVAGKITTYYQAAAPATSKAVTGDLWINTTNQKNTLFRFNGSQWVAVDNKDIQTALTNAANAQSTADSKIITFAQASQPTATDAGDLWIDTDDDNKLYRWNGSKWVSYRDGQIQKAADAALASANQATDKKLESYATNADLNIAKESITSSVESLRKESTIHYFLDEDSVNSVSGWSSSSNPSAEELYTVEKLADGSYRICLDGTSFSSYGAYIYQTITYDAAGEFTERLKFAFDGDSGTFTIQPFFMLAYRTSSGSYFSGTWIQSTNGTILVKTKSSNGDTISPDADGVYTNVSAKSASAAGKNEEVRLYFVPGKKVYIYLAECYVQLSSYIKSTSSEIDQKLGSIELSVSEIEENSEASFVSETWTDLDPANWLIDDIENYPISQSTFNDEPCVDLDGRNLASSDWGIHMYLYRINTTQGGKYSCSMKMAPETAINPPTSGYAKTPIFIRIAYCAKNPDPTSSETYKLYASAVNATALSAKQTKTSKFSLNFPETVTVNGYTDKLVLVQHPVYKAYVWMEFYFVPGTIMHFWDFKFTGSLRTYAESSFKINSHNITSKVEADGIISAINQSAESVSISAEKINLHGAVTANNNFKINTNGTIEATGATLSGNLRSYKNGDNSIYVELRDGHLYVYQNGACKAQIGVSSNGQGILQFSDNGSSANTYYNSSGLKSPTGTVDGNFMVGGVLYVKQNGNWVNILSLIPNVSSINQSISNLNTKVAGHDGSINWLTNTVSGQAGTIAVHSTALQNLQTAYDNLAGLVRALHGL